MLWKIDVGSFALYGIRDGGSQRDPHEWLIGSSPEAWVGYEHFLDPEGYLPNTFSCYLLDTGAHRVMIDTGFGRNAPEGVDAGDMPAALARLDVAPTDIDHVVFTHLHPDHILGSVDTDDTPFFPNAAHWTLRREVEHWRAGTDERARGIARVADALDDAEVLNTPDDPGDVVLGVTTFATHGHTPGHVAVRIGSGDAELVIAGDVTFNPIQLWHTDWAFPFDVDKAAAAATRAQFFDDMADSGTPFVAGHFAEPGYGRIVVSADGRQYEALPVQSLP